MAVIVGQIVEPFPALGAQSGAVRRAQWGQRQAQDHRIPHHRFEVESIALEPGNLVGIRRLLGQLSG